MPNVPGFSPPEKLRTTCNNCAVSKVRCTRTKPTCSRCELYKVECVYGPSQRRGRPPARDRARKSTQESVEELDLDFFLATTSSSEYPDANMLTDSAMWTDYDSFSPLPASTISLSSDSIGQRLLTSNIDISAIPIDSAVQSNSSSSDVVCSGNLCASIVFCTLGTLCQPKGILQPSPERGASSDIPFRINDIAVQRLSRMLVENCVNCLQDPSLAYMLYTVVAKILSEYAAILEGLGPGVTETSDQQNAMRMTPVTLGDFRVDLDGDAERRVRAQLLLCALQKVTQLLETLNARLHVRAGFTGESMDVIVAFDRTLTERLGQLSTRLAAIVV
ncbi:hypothetical protein Q7P37_000329 [Cladosporium fusiforme]